MSLSTHTRHSCFLQQPFDAAVQLIVGCYARPRATAGVAYRIIPFSDTTSKVHPALGGSRERRRSLSERPGLIQG